MSTNEEKKFVVRTADSKEDFIFVTEKSNNEGWSFGSTDVTHMGPILEPGFFIGVLDGKRIGHVSAVKFNDKDEKNGFYFIGFFRVDKEYRGRGYGLKIWDTMWTSLDKRYSICLDAVFDLVPLYEKKGFQKCWTSKKYVLSTSNMVQALKTDQENKIMIKKVEEVSFHKLFEYDTSVFGFPREKFLEKWITIPDSRGWVAQNEREEIIGYVMIRPSNKGRDVQIVGPLFSDNTNIARVLMYTSAKAAIDQSSAKNLTMYVPVSVNLEATDLIEKEIGYEYSLCLARLYSKGEPPQTCLKKVVAITSPAIE